MGSMRQGHIFHNGKGTKGKVGGVSNRSFRSGYRDPPKPTKKQLRRLAEKNGEPEKKPEPEQIHTEEGPSLWTRFKRLLSGGAKEGED